MALADSIQKLKQTAGRVADRLDTEEATKMSLVVPFLGELGFDPFDPDVVVPEFTADVGTKKGEKVDYALKQDGKIIMLIECKSAQTNLSDAHYGQLFRYFSVTEARVDVLTNGLEYWFLATSTKRINWIAVHSIDFHCRNITMQILSSLNNSPHDPLTLNILMKPQVC